MISVETAEGLYQAILYVQTKAVANLTVKEKEDIWHQRLGHLSDRTIKGSLHHIRGIPVDEVSEPSDCSYCSLSKSVRCPRKIAVIENGTAVKVMERVHTDVVDPMRQSSLGGSKYFATLFDSFSGFSMVRFIEIKSETVAGVTDMIREAENLLCSATKRLISTNCNAVKWVRLDGGGDFVGQSF